MNNNIKTEINRIDVPDELENRIKLGAELANKESNPDTKQSSFPTQSKKRKIAYIIGAAIILCLLLVNSLLSSKTVLAYVAEIPVLSNMFNLDPLSELIYTELEENNLDMNYVEAIQVSLFPEKKITVTLGGPAGYPEAVNEKIKQTVEMFLHREKYDTFQIHITEQKDQFVYKLTETQQKEKEHMENEIKALLADLKITYETIYVEPIDKTIYIQVGTSINSVKELKKHAEYVKNKLVNKKDFGVYELDVTAAEPGMIIGDNFTFTPLTDLSMKINKLAAELTEKKVYKVTGFSYKEEPLSFEIHTSVSSSDKEHGNFIEKTIDSYFQSSDVAPSLNGRSYEIIVYSKNQKQIN